jgi:hypothetical protein
VHDVALPVAEDLELDVPRFLQELLQVEPVVSEGRLRYTPPLLQRPEKIRRLVDDRHPLAAAARARFDQDGNPIPAAFAARSSSPLSEPSVPGTTGTPAARACRRAASLSPIRSIAAGGGPTQRSPAPSTARANAAFSERNP